MNNKYYDYSNIDFSKIKLIQFIKKDPENPEHLLSDNVEKIFQNEYIPLLLTNIKPVDNLLLTHLNIQYKRRTKIYITTPVMMNIFGINKRYNTFEMNLSFLNIDDNPKMKGFYDVIKTFEYTQMAQIGLTKDTQSNYLSQIKQSKDKKYDPYITIKLPFRYNKFDIDIYNKTYSGQSIIDIKHGNHMRCNIFIDKIQKYNGKYICKWKCSYIEMINKKN